MTDFNEDLDFGINLRNDADIQAKQLNKTQVSSAKSTNSNQGMNENKKEQNFVGLADYKLSEAGHPTICIATFAFKVAAFVMYFFVGWVISDILTFIFVLVLSAMDFWVVKNVTGRILVGLRWRSSYDQKGKQVWKFQSYDTQFKGNSIDKAFFWGSQAAGVVVWGLFFVLKVLSFSVLYAVLLFICTSLCLTNFYGYYQCRGEHHKKLKDLKSKIGTQIGTQGLMHFAGKFM